MPYKTSDEKPKDMICHMDYYNEALGVDVESSLILTVQRPSCYKQYIEEINTIADFIRRNGWLRGYRNNMAVNLCICWAGLGMPLSQHGSPFNTAHPFVKFLESLNKFGSDDEEDLRVRAETIGMYVSNWNYNLDDYGFVLNFTEPSEDMEIMKLDTIQWLDDPQ